MMHLSGDTRRAVEEFCQFLRWAGEPYNPGEYRLLAYGWYSGLLTIEEGIRIEESRQVWQPYEYAEVL